MNNIIVKYYKIRECPKWNQNQLLNKCSYGENCKFAHGIKELRCKFYQDGNCKKGNNCEYKHLNNNLIFSNFIK